MSERVEVGRICYKGPHVALIGEDDFGCCGSHYYATVYVSIELDHQNPRDQEITVEDVAEDIRKRVADADAHAWCSDEEAPE